MSSLTTRDGQSELRRFAERRGNAVTMEQPSSWLSQLRLRDSSLEETAETAQGKDMLITPCRQRWHHSELRRMAFSYPLRFEQNAAAEMPAAPHR